MTGPAGLRSRARSCIGRPFLAAACVSLASCAGPLGLFGLGEPTPLFRDRTMSVQDAGRVIVSGRTTKAEVSAMLGDAKAIKFDSGFEVWSYRGRSPEAAAAGNTEFVILFAPSGVVQKTRIRLPDGRQPV